MDERTVSGGQRWECRGTLRRCFGTLGLVALVLVQDSPGAPAAGAEAAPHLSLRIVGGLANLSQFTVHEQPFWSRDLEVRSGGRISAEIAPFDESGIRGADMLELMRLGVVPFGTALLSLVETGEPVLGGMDLPGLNLDFDSLRRTVAAYRPTVEEVLRDRYGVMLLAIYSYPAQVAFCREPIEGLGDLHRRRVRSSNLQQSDFLEALGATPVRLPFAAVATALRDRVVDCAITGTLSGNTVGLHELTSHLHALPIQWGLSLFGANLKVWSTLPAEVRTFLEREIAALEERIWQAAARDTVKGLACNAGLPSCTGGTPGRMTVVTPGEGDRVLARSALEYVVLPRWLARCGAECAADWKARVGLAGAALP